MDDAALKPKPNGSAARSTYQGVNMYRKDQPPRTRRLPVKCFVTKPPIAKRLVAKQPAVKQPVTNRPGKAPKLDHNGNQTLVAPLQSLTIGSRTDRPATGLTTSNQSLIKRNNHDDSAIEDEKNKDDGANKQPTEKAKPMSLSQLPKINKKREDHLLSDNMMDEDDDDDEEDGEIRQSLGKRKSDDHWSDEDMMDEDVQEQEDEENKDGVKKDKKSPKKVKEPKPKNPFLLERPHAPSLNTKPKPKNVPPVAKIPLNTRPKHHKQTTMMKRQKMKISVELINRCLAGANQGKDIDEPLLQLRQALHELEHYEFITEELVEELQLLETGLPSCFSNVIFPWDIRSDAKVIFNRWKLREFDSHLLRGITTARGTNPTTGKAVTTHTPQEDYSYNIPYASPGAGILENGQWWPFQICAVRDGAHGSFEAGIYGEVGKGAYSIVLGGAKYSDIDEGNVIQYCGTSGAKDKPTLSTKRMLESRRLGNEVRVLRSSGMSKNKSRYRPKEGLRYDGVYTVVAHELLHEDTAMYRFTLHRCPGQPPIRWQGVEARPTAQDLLQKFLLNQQ
ncbi:MAG: hypothetical protein Q9201_005202 [Fulgogasparrea decipioides]